MASRTSTVDVAELLDEAAAARQLAASFKDSATIRDLLDYARELEASAALERRHSVKPARADVRRSSGH
jgi:hypothetical protein